MNVLSLFDGISCGQLALEKAGVKVDNYFASEIDDYSIEITKQNYPKTKHLGDVIKVNGNVLPKIDLLIGGSPCQGFSFAGKQLNFNDPRSKLFFEFHRLLIGLKPKYFLLENVKMKEESLSVITELLGVKPVLINSSLVSAQNRLRYYWTNLPIPSIEDRGIFLENIIDKNLPFDKEYKCYNFRETKNYIQFDVSGKGYNSQQDRAYFIKGKFGTFPNARAITKRKITNGAGFYRDLTLNECEALQNLPINYTMPLGLGKFSLNKSLSAIGNGWTVDIIVEFFKNLNNG